MTRFLATFLVLASVLAGVGCGQSPGNVAKEYVECTVRGDIEGMRACVAGEAAAKLADPMAPAAAAAAKAIIDQVGGVSGCEVVSESISGDAATVLIKLIPKQTAPELAMIFAQPRPVRLAKVDGAWKVIGD